MKNFTKSMSLILVLVLALSCVTGCSNKNNNPVETTESTIATDVTLPTEVEETVDETVAETIPDETVAETEATEPAETESASTEATEATTVTEPVETEVHETETTSNNIPTVNYTSVNETVYATNDVNVRTGPGTDHSKVGTLAAGESVIRIGVGNNGWSKVTYNGETAYISSNYLTTTKPAAKTATETSGSVTVETEPVHTHSYSCKETAPTCTEKGYTTYTCACGDSYTGSETAAKGHSYKNETVAPTTGAQGYDIHTCKTCGYSYKDNYTDKVPAQTTEPVHTHNYGSKVTAPTCENKGYTTYTCSCGDSYKADYKDATGHNYKNETVAPTTSAQGYDLHTCKNCGYSYKDNYKDAVKESGPIHTNSSVYNALIAFKSKYPEGMAFDNSVNYSWSAPYNGSVIFFSASGCTAFASELSISAFGTKSFATLYNITINDVRVGDILRINGNTHSVIVLEVYADHVVIAEANYGGKVHWGRTLTAEQVANADYLISRYSDRL